MAQIAIPHWEVLHPSVGFFGDAPEIPEELPLAQMCGTRIVLIERGIIWHSEREALLHHNMPVVDLSGGQPAVASSTHNVHEALVEDYGTEGEHNGALAARQLGYMLLLEGSRSSMWLLPTASVHLMEVEF